jgi:predicted RNA-binding Zn-ribbon protein involved in translation (DUF1610 family)
VQEGRILMNNTIHAECPQCGQISILELDIEGKFPKELRYMCDCGFEGAAEEWKTDE